MPNHQIFISYATEDKNLAFRVVDALEAEDFVCWIAPRDIAGGERFVNAIMTAIRHSELFIVLISRYSIKKNFVKSETAHAFENNKLLLPIRIEDVEPDDELRFYIGRHHYLEIWNKRREIYLSDIIKKVNNLLYKEKERPSPILLRGEDEDLKLPPGVFQIKVTDERSKSEILKLMQFLSTFEDSIQPPIKRKAIPTQWLKSHNQYMVTYLKSVSGKRWLTNRFELILNNPPSLENLTLLDALLILPPLRSEFDQVYENLINLGRAVIMGHKYTGKKIFLLYLAYHWSVLEHSKVWFIENPNLISEKEWDIIENYVAISNSDSKITGKILFIIFQSNTSEIDSKLKRFVNLANNTKFSLLFVSESDKKDKSVINYFQELLKLPRRNDIVEINQNRNWKQIYKLWINSMLKLVFNLNPSILTNQINEVDSIMQLQEKMDVLNVIKMNNFLNAEKYEEIIDEIDSDEKNILLHQILIEALLQKYSSDIVLEILDNKKEYYQNYNNLGMWYYYYGKALILKGEHDNAIEKFQSALKYLNLELYKEIKDEISEWMG